MEMWMMWWPLIDKRPSRQTERSNGIFSLNRPICFHFIRSTSAAEIETPPRPWQRWHRRDGCTAGQRKVIYFRWPARSSGLKLSLLIWLLLCLFFFTPTESTLLLQLLQTEKVMGLRFCPDKGVRTLSLLLTPLSHQWDREGGGGDGGREGWGALRGCQSKLTTQLLFKTICHRCPNGLFLSDPSPKKGKKKKNPKRVDGLSRQEAYSVLSYQMRARDCRSAHILGSGSRWKVLKGYLSSQANADCQRRNRKPFQSRELRGSCNNCNPAVTLWKYIRVEKRHAEEEGRG